VRGALDAPAAIPGEPPITIEAVPFTVTPTQADRGRLHAEPEKRVSPALILKSGVGILATAFGGPDGPGGGPARQRRACRSVGCGRLPPIVAPDLGKPPFEWDNGVVFRPSSSRSAGSVAGQGLRPLGYNGSARTDDRGVEGDRVQFSLRTAP
jgi:hypothetical protein